MSNKNQSKIISFDTNNYTKFIETAKYRNNKFDSYQENLFLNYELLSKLKVLGFPKKYCKKKGSEYEITVKASDMTVIGNKYNTFNQRRKRDEELAKAEEEKNKEEKKEIKLDYQPDEIPYINFGVDRNKHNLKVEAVDTFEDIGVEEMVFDNEPVLVEEEFISKEEDTVVVQEQPLDMDSDSDLDLSELNLDDFKGWSSSDEEEEFDIDIEEEINNLNLMVNEDKKTNTNEVKKNKVGKINKNGVKYKIKGQNYVDVKYKVGKKNIVIKVPEKQKHLFESRYTVNSEYGNFTVSSQSQFSKLTNLLNDPLESYISKKIETIVNKKVNSMVQKKFNDLKLQIDRELQSSFDRNETLIKEFYSRIFNLESGLEKLDCSVQEVNVNLQNEHDEFKRSMVQTKKSLSQITKIIHKIAGSRGKKK
jgi:hypothetical protein